MNATSSQNPASLPFLCSAFHALPLLLFTLALQPEASLRAQLTVTETKLHGRAKTSQTGNGFGNAVAVSDTYLLVGEPGNKDKGDDAGAAHVFNAKTGKYLRKLTAKDAAVGDKFGTSVAINGHFALIGAPWDDEKANDAGAAYVFDLRTGKQKRKFIPASSLANQNYGSSVALQGDTVLIGAPGFNDARGALYHYRFSNGFSSGYVTSNALNPNDNFGASVALNGNLMVIGAPGDDEKGTNAGAAYVRYLSSSSGSSALHKLTASDGAANDNFGRSVAINGGLALIGAPLDDNANGTDAGAAYLFSARSGGQLTKFIAQYNDVNDGAANDHFGRSVALSGYLALIGAPLHNGSRGAAYLFDSRNHTSWFPKLTASDGAIGDIFGYAVALNGNHAVISAPLDDDDDGNNSGAAYFYTPLFQPIWQNIESVTFGTSTVFPATVAPGAPETHFKAFQDTFINLSRQAVFQASLIGPGAKGGRNRGVWDTSGFGVNPPYDPARYLLRLKDDPAEIKITKIHKAWSNRTNNTLVLADIKWSGRTYQDLYRANAAGLDYIFSTFEAGYQKFHEVAQSGLDYIAINGQLRRGGAVNKRNDSRITFINHGGDAIGSSVTEGDVVNAGVSRLGQLFKRVAVSRANQTIASGASLIFDDGSPARQTLFSKNPALGGGVNTLAAIQGGIAENTGGATYRSLLGESVSYDGVVLWRASLKGSGVTSKNNEGLWLQNGHRLIARKDRSVQGFDVSGEKIARILRFWPANGDTQALLLVKLKGPGVKASNDLALLLWDANDLAYPRILLREGQAVDGTDGAHVRVIQRVDVEPRFGHYVVLASLTGAAARNQALFAGNTLVGNATTEAGRLRRLPVLRLRKGVHYQPFDGFVTLRGMSLPVTTDKTGAGGKGQGQAIAFHQTSLAAWTALTTHWYDLEFLSKYQTVMVFQP